MDVKLNLYELDTGPGASDSVHNPAMTSLVGFEQRRGRVAGFVLHGVPVTVGDVGQYGGRCGNGDYPWH